ncbi:MAG: DNA adenine methylase [Acidobacteriia bacterium]|nr:DNA adenine methylase [Terriglobia bacterium]
MAKRARSRRKLAIWAALPPYLGGKRRLCPLIFREIDRVLPRRLWVGRTFLDAFLGGGSVSLYAKAQGFRVIATDIATRAVTIGRALIENSRVRLTYNDVVRLAAPTDAPPGRIEREYVPSVFTQAQGRFIDRALATAGKTEDPAKAALFRLLAVRVALLAHPYSQVRKGTIHRVTTGEYESITESAVYHYVDGLRLTHPDKLWALARQINAGVFQGEGRVLQTSVLDALPTIEADVVYFDPPYPGVMSYEREYKVIDEILEGASRPTSPFTARDGAAMIDGLFEQARHIPIWLLSLGNAVVTIGELEEKMARLGRRTRAIEIKYQHLPAVATDEKKEKNREFLVVGWDPESELLRSVGKISPTAPEQDLAFVPGEVEIHLDRRGALRPAPSGFLQDGFQEGHAPLVEKSDPRIGAGMSPEGEPRVDLPDAALHSMAGDRDVKARALHDDHPSRVLPFETPVKS